MPLSPVLQVAAEAQQIEFRGHLVVLLVRGSSLLGDRAALEVCDKLLCRPDL